MATLIAARASTGHYLSAIERAESDRAHEPAWLRDVRRSAADAFGRMGIPTTRDEEWRVTNVTPIADTPFSPAPLATASSEEAARLVVPGLSGPLLVFVNGRYAAELSAPGVLAAGLTVSTIADAIERDPESLEPFLARHADSAVHPFAALNTALFEDGALVALADNTVAALPVQLVFLSTVTPLPAMSAPRVLVVLGRNSQAKVIETFGSLGHASGFTNAVTEVVVGDGSVLEHCRLQRESESAFHVGYTGFHVGGSSRSSSHAFAFGGRISRHDTVAVLADEGADCTLNGLYLAGGNQLIDNHTEIDHARPHGTSHELYKGILGGRARGVFNGRIRVRPDAQKTDAKQTNKALLLSDEAQVNTKPQLEIFANDVRCTHGATVGQLSQDALFYLRTRGIGLDDAKSLLVRAFAADVTSRIALEPARAELDRLLAARLPALLGEEAPR
jgi:Fe-S cluster assembly protein SufD